MTASKAMPHSGERASCADTTADARASAAPARPSTLIGPADGISPCAPAPPRTGTPRSPPAAARAGWRRLSRTSVCLSQALAVPVVPVWGEAVVYTPLGKRAQLRPTADTRRTAPLPRGLRGPDTRARARRRRQRGVPPRHVRGGGGHSGLRGPR